MKRILQFSLILLLLSGLSAAVPQLHAQQAGANNVAKAKKADATESNNQLESFRHSPAVQTIARHLGLSTELTAKIFEDINSAILIGVILWGIFLFVPKMYRKRSQALARDILDARTATAEARVRLTVVEDRLSKLSVEIDAIREQTEHDAANDEKRIHESLETEKQRLLASVDQEIEAAGAAARRDLKKYAARLAIDRATTEINISEADDRALIRSFGEHFSNHDHPEDRN